MDDPTPGAEGADALPSAEAAASAGSARPVADDRCKLSVGARWRGFHVEALAPGGPVHAFEATNIGLMEKVLITASPVTPATEWRKGTWQKLCTQIPAGSHILGCCEAFAEDGWRYEVMNRPPATTLREWMSNHQADGATHRLILEQLTVALGALHAAGIVHLNIRPETIYVDETAGPIEIVLGGLDSATLYNHSNVTVAGVDFFYAPPEAADAAGPQPGIGLCAWDWWTVGRVMQELVLGRHVLSVLFSGDVIREPTARLRAQAEALLLEREPAGLRAGAVEAMNKLEPGVETMLRGLLTTARAARWTGDVVRRWLAKEKVCDHYELVRDARFFTWGGRGFSLPEAVEYFRTEENWAGGEKNICDAQDPATLAHFIGSAPGHQADDRKLQELLAQLEPAAWDTVPASARRTVTTALAWLVLGPAPANLVVRGQPIDVGGLAALLGDNLNEYNCANVRALTFAPCLAVIKRSDPAAAEILTQLAAVGLEALRRAEEARWVDPADPGGEAHLLRLALETEATLQTRADRVRAAYATNRDTELARLLGEKQPAPWVNVLLVITAEDPRRFGYVTKAEHARQQLAAMQTQSQQLRLAVFWLRLQRMLLAGGPCTGRWPVFVGCWLGLVGLGVAVARDIPTTLSLAVTLVGLRLLVSWRVRVLARRSAGPARPWNWRDGPRRCAEEARHSCPEAATVPLPRLVRRLARLEGEIGQIAPEESKDRPQDLPLPVGLWVGLAVGILLCCLGAGRLAVNTGHAVKASITGEPQKAKSDAPGSVLMSVGANQPAVDSLSDIPGLTPEMREKVARGEYEVVADGFGRTLHGPITKWDLTPTATPAALPIEARVQASSSQRAYALVSAELLLRPYGRKAVNALIIVHVPTRDRFGVMVYNARDRLLVDNDTLVVRDELPARTWYKVANRNVVYLGVPAEIGQEISLALR